ncbi:MAG: aldehyde dehydrogenase family protein [Nitriliruptorales bacterium]|nr:aldehyde dehydrogenase family protein [Nitriliruptorales bacterium]
MSSDRTRQTLDSLEAGMPVVYGGNRVTHVGDELAAAFQPGDALIVLEDSGDLLHLPKADQQAATDAVERAVTAAERMGAVDDEQISDFYERFAQALEDEARFAPIREANNLDVKRAKERGRSTTRLTLSDKMRADMVDGLRAWRDAPSGRGRVVDRIEHPGWAVEEVVDRLGVVGFVFEGRPNVFADATGVLRSGNTVVFRIGSDALGTARAIMQHALGPALEDAGLPPGATALVDSPAHAAGWALFADRRLSLAVARGSGSAVRQLGAVARQAGNPVSLHGTGGAWIVAAETADAEAFRAAVYHSLDRKVCNTLNTCCIVADRADDLVPVFLDALEAAARRRDVSSKLHVEEASCEHVPSAWFDRTVAIVRADGAHDEPQAEPIGRDELGHEWEWEDSPEVSLAVVDDVAQAVAWFNELSPHFAASLISEDPDEHTRFFDNVEAPFVGNGFTRWVDGQYALGKPELGLSNWQHGRLFGRSAILSGDSVYTLRLRARQSDPDIGR